MERWKVQTFSGRLGCSPIELGETVRSESSPHGSLSSRAGALAEPGFSRNHLLPTGRGREGEPENLEIAAVPLGQVAWAAERLEIFLRRAAAP